MSGAWAFALASPPALSGLNDEGRAGKHGQCKENSEGLRLHQSLHSYSHRIPAPAARAIEARIAKDQIRRVSVAFFEALMTRRSG